MRKQKQSDVELCPVCEGVCPICLEELELVGRILVAGHWEEPPAGTQGCPGCGSIWGPEKDPNYSGCRGRYA